jgi:hypothetical protein
MPALVGRFAGGEEEDPFGDGAEVLSDGDAGNVRAGMYGHGIRRENFKFLK